MRTIIYQSDMRANDPVGGCYKYIQDLQAQIEYCKTELDLVLQQLAVFRAQSHQQPQQQEVVNYGDQVIMNSDSLLGFYNPFGSIDSATAPAHYHYNVQQQAVPQLQEHEQEQYIMMHESNSSSSSINSTTPLQPHVNNWGAMQSSISLSSLSLHGQSSNASEEYDHKPILDIPCAERNELGFDSGEILHHRKGCVQRNKIQWHLVSDPIPPQQHIDVVLEGRGHGRGRLGDTQCQVCFKFGHITSMCYPRFNQQFRATIPPDYQGCSQGFSGLTPQGGAPHYGLTNAWICPQFPPQSTLNLIPSHSHKRLGWT
ncbi:hypothetical protein TSUD_183790 [Trifolium subterraneum]|uniref:LOB domain-containing protein n=1 Tax=Trifolium subterraneum TaxID=3900 RepID=A0A2Z6MVR1_TRISU|nr:hypothetical protein TSUD_183790 [Trifolium subterraneum]